MVKESEESQKIMILRKIEDELHNHIDNNYIRSKFNHENHLNVMLNSTNNKTIDKLHDRMILNTVAEQNQKLKDKSSLWNLEMEKEFYINGNNIVLKMATTQYTIKMNI